MRVRGKREFEDGTDKFTANADHIIWQNHKQCHVSSTRDGKKIWKETKHTLPSWNSYIPEGPVQVEFCPSELSVRPTCGQLFFFKRLIYCSEMYKCLHEFFH